MNEAIEHLKRINCYTEVAKSCSQCHYYKEDPSTDNFGKGDTCTRNPDITLRVRPTASCNKWTKK